MKKMIMILAVLCAAAVVQARPQPNLGETNGPVIIDRLDPKPPRITSWPMLIAYLRRLAR